MVKSDTKLNTSLIIASRYYLKFNKDWRVSEEYLGAFLFRRIRGKYTIL
jgi:hypothetical protein